jgi:predicted Ser/Thr protein kinase
MGEVYRAKDARLGRDIALKVLKEDVASDPERLRRFQQEARAASSLNHPNIVVVYEVGEATLSGRQTPVSYLAMELLEGESLANLAASGNLSSRRVLDIASQLADGLACAHEKGLVHRDLKPSNVVITRDGRVKILDFGLAKLRSLPTAMTSLATTVEGPPTEPGTILGTVGYMSPEQARGEPASAASDQFSLGCIVYEMLTGRRPFARSSTVETLSAILRDDPTPIDPAVPGPLRWVVERCLAKSPRERYDSTGDLARELHALKDHSSEIGIHPLPEERQPRLPGRLVWAAAASLAAFSLGLLGFFLWGIPRRPATEPDFRRLSFRHGFVSRALFVPNSQEILYAAAWEGQSFGTFLALPESVGQDRSLRSGPQLPMAYSEDGSQLLVLLGPLRASLAPSGTLAWWPALGGEPRPLLESSGWADWARRGHFLAVARDTGAQRQLEVRNVEGRLLRTVFQTPGAISFVRVSPDEKNLAFIHHPSRADAAGEVRVVGVDGGNSRALTPQYEVCFGLDWNPTTDEIWFTASRPEHRGQTNVQAVNLSGRTRLVYALPGRTVLQAVAADRSLLVNVEDRTGLLVQRSSEPARNLSWFDGTFVSDLSPDGRLLLFFEAGPTQSVTGSWTRPVEGGGARYIGAGERGKFSPDGRWIVAQTVSPKGTQIALLPTGAGPSRQLTFSQAVHSAPAFAGPDTLIFVRSEKAKSEVWQMQTDGTGARSMGAENCDLPAANPGADSFVCSGDGDRSLLVYPMRGGEARTLYQLPADDRFRYARWDETGKTIFAATSRRRFLALDASSGTVLREEELSVPGLEAYDTLYTAAFNSDATIRAYSVSRFSSDLYLASRLR